MGSLCSLHFANDSQLSEHITSSSKIFWLGSGNVYGGWNNKIARFVDDKIFSLNPTTVVCCAKRSKDDKTCLEHIYDKLQAKKWQLFDIEDFNEGWGSLTAYMNDVSKALESSGRQPKTFEINV